MTVEQQQWLENWIEALQISPAGILGFINKLGYVGVSPADIDTIRTLHQQGTSRLIILGLISDITLGGMDLSASRHQRGVPA